MRTVQGSVRDARAPSLGDRRARVTRHARPHRQDLFWMSRQIERAENMARLLEVGFRISLPPATGDGHREEWRSTLPSAGCEQGFLAKHGDLRHARRRHFMLFDEDNPSSVRSCLETARTNAPLRAHQDHPRHVGGLNSTWLDLRGDRQPSDHLRAAAAAARLDPGAHGAVPRRAARHDPARRQLLLQPARHLRRARRQHGAHPRREIFHPAAAHPDGRRRDRHYQWETILRSVSAHRTYRHVYQRQLPALEHRRLPDPQPEMPRSLRFCYDGDRAIDGLGELYGSSDGLPVGSPPRRAHMLRTATWTRSSRRACTSS